MQAPSTRQPVPINSGQHICLMTSVFLNSSLFVLPSSPTVFSPILTPSISLVLTLFLSYSIEAPVFAVSLDGCFEGEDPICSLPY